MSKSRPGRKAVEVVVSDEQRNTLDRWARARTTSQALAHRARMILLCADGWTNREVAGHMKVAVHTVGKWRKRFVSLGVEGLSDPPRPNVHRKLTATCGKLMRIAETGH